MEKVTDKEYWMDSYLKGILDSVCHNMKNDWDFVIPITGDGMVRVGKSVIAQQAGYYVAYKMGTPFNIDNIIFNGEDLRKLAAKFPKNSVIIYDEAREGLDSKKTMERVSRNLQDFFAECGIYNHLIILVMPNFFELNKSIAVTRSEFLINVFRNSKEVGNLTEYVRGGFEFFNRKKKKELYFQGKKLFESYDVVKRNFYGEFRNFWVIDKEEYHKKKKEFLIRETPNKSTHIWQRQRDVLIRHLCKEEHYTQQQVSKLLEKNGIGLTKMQIGRITREMSYI